MFLMRVWSSNGEAVIYSSEDTVAILVRVPVDAIIRKWDDSVW